MPKVFRTPKDSPDSVEVSGVAPGLAGAFGKGGIPVDVIVGTFPHSFSDDGGKLLKGKALDTAVEEWGEARGLTVTSESDEKIAGFAEELGRPAERPPLGETAVDLVADLPVVPELVQTGPSDSTNEGAK